MKSIKPGRGPSMMNGIAGIGAAIFGVVWTMIAFSVGAGFMAIFGFVFIGMAIANVIYNFKNATSENRYSMFDITYDNEEPDPLNQKYRRQNNHSYQPSNSSKGEFCPYCGNGVKKEFEFCNKCGKKLP